MNREIIRDRVMHNLIGAGLSVEEVRVQPSPGGGWQVVVISDGFGSMATSERQDLVRKGFELSDIKWIEALTLVEKEWAGPTLIDSSLENFPLWPEALDRAELNNEQPILFPSDLDEDIEPPVIATFYSLRGGVGRSTALAYTGRILASRGRKVVCVDMDLEAPGLAALFGREKEVQEGMGLVHVLAALDRGENPDITKHLLRVTDSEDLYCLPAGVPDAKYAHMLRFLDPSAWYREERNPLRLLMEKLRVGLPFKPDAILLDSRTGITSLSGPLLFDLADIAIIAFFPHPQAEVGTRALVRALLAAKTSRASSNGSSLTPEPRFIVSPVPSSKVPEVIRRYEHRALEWVGDWLRGLTDRGESKGALLESDITHFVPYRDLIATSDQVMSERDAWRDYETVADWVDRFLRTPGERVASISIAEEKLRTLGELYFSAGTAEQQTSLLDTFVETDLIRKALNPSIPLVLGRKGTGKTAIFRRLAEGSSRTAVIISAPAPLRGERTWLLGVEGFRGVSEILAASGADWRQFWTLYVCVASYFGWPFDSGRHAAPNSTWGEELGSVPRTELEVVNLIGQLVSTPNSGLLANDWLARIDDMAGENTLLLFDGLDTGFGSTDDDRKRRRSALEGLFSFVIDRGDGFKNLRMKIMLREDIWRHLRFENKSHFFGRSVTLKWSDPASFFKVVVKQALRSDGFKKLLAESSVNVQNQVDVWSERDVFAAWNILIGERMKGGKTTFTRNWVWNRLGDAHDDHSPRYLLQLMHQVIEWERKEHARNPYDRSIVRPRGLEEVLPSVSEQALGALRDEEFPELQPLLEKLTEIGRTPIDASDLEVSTDLINLGREVGLLGIYEGSEERVERYKVPELFRWALKMSRRGQK